MCPPDSIVDPKHTTANNTVVAIRPTQILNPYPERARSLAGVRSYTAHIATQPRKSAYQFGVSGRRHPFGASVLITIAAQGLLAAAIASQTLSPIIGAAAAVGLVLCGLGLVVAELIQVTGR